MLNKSQLYVMKKILQNKLSTSHKNNNCILSMIFYVLTTKKTATIATAAIMIFTQAIVSVKTTTAATVTHTWPDMVITITTTTATATKIKTKTKTLYDLSKNPIIAQQSRKISTETQIPPNQPTPYSSAATILKASSTLNSSHMSDDTATMTQPTVRSVRNFSLATAVGECKSPTAAWGHVNPNIFYICDKQTKQPLQLRCPQGTGFFLGLGYSGCIPYEQWPACISSGHQVRVCDSKHMQQPWECKNPNKFYVCLKDTIEPTIVNCEPGKGFVHAIIKTSVGGGGDAEIVGCAKWEKWRYYMHCHDYILKKM